MIANGGARLRASPRRPGAARRPHHLFALLAGVALAGLVLSACSSGDASPEAPSLPTGTLRIDAGSGSVSLDVWIAQTEQARERGLMGIRDLGPDRGMAFLFGRPVESAFWMKDTLIPLSIAFWGPDGRILRILEMRPCRGSPCPLYSPGVPYVGAVEATRGYFAAHGITPGDRVRLIRP